MTDQPSDPVTRLNAALEGRYRIESELGEGGMATVYLAEDIKHERKVALKVLKPELAAVVGAERFLAEIKTTANLTHPHILPLHDSGEADGFVFYVMPYVEGESLRDRLNRDHQLPVDDAVRIATNVAEALDYAHRHGVIHRDIKPANILLQDGKPVISDFGIALAVGTAGQGRLTETGLSVGTPHYMSPEQATGDQSVGPATDIYALGAVLYEMLVGEPPYTGSTAQAVLGKIIAGKLASAAGERASVPANVDAAIRKALEKLPADRFTGAQEFAGALADRGFQHGEIVSAEAALTGRGLWNPLSFATSGLALALALGLGWALLRPASRPLARLEVPLGEGLALVRDVGGVTLALSPDGSRLVYVGSAPDGRTQLWHRPMDQLEAQPIAGSEGARNPVFSPDGGSVAFMTAESIKTVSLQGGVGLTVMENFAFRAFGMDWGSDGMLYFEDAAGGLQRVAASGGAPERLSTAGFRMRWVDVLPGSQGLIFTNSGQIAVASKDGAEVRRLFPGVMARYAHSGHLVYVTEDRTLMAVPFDPRRLQVTGAAVALIQDIAVNITVAGQFALSETGTLAYITGADQLSQLVRVGRNGAAEEIVPGQSEAFVSLAISPDETRLAVSIASDAGGAGANVPQDVWIKQLDRGPLTKLTFEGAINLRPTWTPDARSVTFVSNRAGGFDLWTTRADGTGSAQLVEDVDRPIYGATWSADGVWLLSQAGGAGERDILGLRPSADSVPSPLLDSDFDEFSPALSPDGRWLAYVSNEQGRDEVFVRPFPNVDSGKWQISQEGGTVPVWAHSGRELFYRSATPEMVVVQIDTSSAFQWGEKRVLFSLADYISGAVPVYAVSRDGQHFIMLRRMAAEREGSVTVVLNFFEELKRRVPPN